MNARKHAILVPNTLRDVLGGTWDSTCNRFDLGVQDAIHQQAEIAFRDVLQPATSKPKLPSPSPLHTCEHINRYLKLRVFTQDAQA